jgi:hypothetical protein
VRYVNLAQAEAYYSVARRAGLSWRTIEHPSLEGFSKAVLNLSRLAKEQDDDTGWREFLYPARRARNIAATVPLPFSHPRLGIAPLIEQLERSLPALRVYGGEDAGALGEAVVTAGQALQSLDDAPLLDAIVDIVELGEPVPSGVLLPIAEYTTAVDEFIGVMGLAHPVEVLSRHDIANVNPLGRLAVIGPLYWYQDHQYVLTSPRASQIVVLKWAWYREQPPSATVLEGSRGAAGIKVQPLPIATSRFAIGPNDERSTVDWQSISQELSRAGEGDPSEPVAARAAVLAGRYAVLLPEDGDRLVWLLDPYAPPEHRAARVDVADLEPGHVIILRTSGGGDLIVPIADEILGDQAPALRELQHRWKAGLRGWVRQRWTIGRAVAELRRAGCARANPQNLQNWLGERSLRTEDRRDWQVLMAAASLDAEAETIWRAMGRLHSAHSEAGMSIGRRLRDMANTKPLDTLLASGSQVFELARGGSVTAFRIEGFSPAPIQCSPSHLMVPEQVRDEWLT